MRWRVVYTDGSSFSSEDGSPAEAPGGGVAAIAVEDNVVGCAVYEGADFYVHDEEAYGGWMKMDYFGLVQHIIKATTPIVLKIGQSMPTDKFRALIADLAKNGLHKSARYRWEDPHGI